MIPRILEPELMDTADEAVAYDTMDHAAVNRQHVDDFLAALREHGVLPSALLPTTPLPADQVESLPSPPAGPGAAVRDRRPSVAILDLGTGTAHIPIELCRREPNVTVVAVDGAAHMLALAERNVNAAGLSGRIELWRQDAKHLNLGGRTFPIVVSNSLVHHIPRPMDILTQAVQAAAAGGIVWIRDLMRPADEVTLDALVATYAGEESPRQRRLFSDSLRAALTLDEMRALVVQLGFDGEQVQATSDRHWTWVGEKK